MFWLAQEIEVGVESKFLAPDQAQELVSDLFRKPGNDAGWGFRPFEDHVDEDREIAAPILRYAMVDSSNLRIVYE